MRLPTRPLGHPHDREIARLAVPAFGALVAEPLFLLADSAIVGHLGTPQLAGLGIAATVLTTVVSICVFLAYGTTAAVARRLGAGDVPTAISLGVDGMWLAALLGAGLAAAGLLASSALVDALGSPPEAAGYAETYLRVSLLGVPAMLVVLAATGVLRGLQDTRTPLLVAGAGAGGNVALNLVLVYPAGLGIAGSALGTVLTQTGMAAAFVAVVVRGARRHGASMRPRPAGIRSSARTVGPLLVRTLTLRAAFLLLTVVAARLGAVPLAAHQVALNLWMLMALTLDAVAIAGQAIVGRFLGAGDVAGARAATRRMVEWAVGLGLLLGMAVLLACPLLGPVFTEDVAVRDALAAVLLVVAAQQPVAGWVFALDGVLIGAGDGRYLASAGVVALGCFVPIAVAVALLGGGLVALWAAWAAYLLARLVTLATRERTDRWLVTGAALPAR